MIDNSRPFIPIHADDQAEADDRHDLGLYLYLLCLLHLFGVFLSRLASWPPFRTVVIIGEFAANLKSQRPGAGIQGALR